MKKKVKKIKYRNDLQGYTDAVWDFLMEHCDVTETGSLFVKFHVDDKRNFMKRVLGRYRYNYHRGDPRATYKLAQDLQSKNKRIRLSAIKIKLKLWLIEKIYKW